MAGADLTQAEADHLLAMDKRRISAAAYSYPTPGTKIDIPLESLDEREKFSLDIVRGRIALTKVSHQNRARTTAVLARLDLGGSRHRNPDGTEVDCPHLHLYQAGFGVKWAVVPPPANFPRLDDLWGTLEDFMTFCRVVTPPTIQGTVL